VPQTSPPPATLTVRQAPAPAAAPRELDSVVRRLVADNLALAAEADSLRASLWIAKRQAPAAPAPAAPVPPPVPAPTPAPAPEAAQPTLQEALQRAAALTGDPSVLRKTPDGYIFALNRSLTFGSNKTELGPEAREDLRRLALVAFRFPAIRLVVEGHTDSVGSSTRNQSLSLSRADTVRSLLLWHGLEASRVSARGFGPTVPVADNATAEGRARNRRVEIRILPGTAEESR
jgi:outer membrane protein OmpA-like peptidoglycan-associated protein